MATDERVVIVSPASGGPPLVPSVRVRCSECGCSCWLSRGNAGLAIFHRCVCVPCHNRYPVDPSRVYVTPEGTRKDFRRAGFTEAQIDEAGTLLERFLRKGGKP